MPIFIRWLPATVATLAAVCAAAAEPFEPPSPDTVLARLPAAEVAVRPALAQRAAELKADPSRNALRAALARDYIDLHRATGDPRYLGFAETTLDGRSATLELQLATAHVLQARHGFSEASSYLQQLVARAPRERRAWLALASVAETVGDYRLARDACARLIVLGDDLSTRVCAASVASMTGNSEAALAQLDAALASATEVERPLLGWARIVAGEIAQRSGDNASAERHLSAALGLTTDVYASIAYADLLLDLRRYDEVVAVLADRPESDAVLLRRAIAARQLGTADADDLAARVGQRLQTLGWRNDTRHAREQALFALHLADDPDAALAAAKSNWQLQKESIDARLLLEAAIAAARPTAAEPVLQWMDDNGSDDVRLLRLRARISS